MGLGGVAAVAVVELCSVLESGGTWPACGLCSTPVWEGG